MIGAEETLDLAEKRALVERVANSEPFRKASRLREFLLYVADCTLENRLSDTREQVIAERVFRRKPDYQGAQDSIVRAEARILRKRLEMYFAGEGKDEPLTITMPRGGYALVFEPRALEEGALEPRPVVIETPPRSLSRWVRWLPFFSLAALSILVAFYSWHAVVRSGRQAQTVEPILPFSSFFDDGRETLIVTSDTGFLQIEWFTRRTLTLNEYIARSYPNPADPKLSELIRNWNLYEFTDGREMSVAGLILRNYPQFAGRAQLRSGHEVTLDELRTHNAVLIGSPISNPWAQLFEDRLNFHCVLDPSGRILFQGKAGAQYPSADDAERGRTYARLVFLPPSPDNPAVLLIAGTTAQSAQVAGELIADRSRFASTLRAIGVNPRGPARFFEILLRSNFFVGGSTVPEIAAWRLTPASEK